MEYGCCYRFSRSRDNLYVGNLEPRLYKILGEMLEKTLTPEDIQGKINEAVEASSAIIFLEPEYDLAFWRIPPTLSTLAADKIRNLISARRADVAHAAELLPWDTPSGLIGENNNNLIRQWVMHQNGRNIISPEEASGWLERLSQDWGGMQVADIRVGPDGVISLAKLVDLCARLTNNTALLPGALTLLEHVYSIVLSK